MQIRAFPPHYQLVHTNFDISPFSLISYVPKALLLSLNFRCFGVDLYNEIVQTMMELECDHRL